MTSVANPAGGYMAKPLYGDARAWMSSLQDLGPAMPEFDYDKTYGANPWVQPTSELRGLVGRMINTYGPDQGWDSEGRTGGSMDTHVARPEDPEVQSYMEHVLGGQRNELDDYVRRAAGAGIQRSGMNVRGGPAFDSSLHHSAMQTLARGYSDRFREAMDYNKYTKSQLYSEQLEKQRSLQNLLNMQREYLTSQADWGNRLATVKHDDWKGEVSWRREAPNRAIQIQQALEGLGHERWKNQVEKEKYRQGIQEHLNDIAAIDQANRPFGRTPYQLMMMEKALVDLGVWKPLERIVKYSK